MPRTPRPSILCLSSRWSLRSLSRGACLALLASLVACGSSSPTTNDGKPTAAQLKVACNAVFDKIISCNNDAFSVGLATNYKGTACTDANAQSFAACASATTLYTSAQMCAASDCATASTCGLGLVPSLQACMPDGGT